MNCPKCKGLLDRSIGWRYTTARKGIKRAIREFWETRFQCLNCGWFVEKNIWSQLGLTRP